MSTVGVSCQIWRFAEAGAHTPDVLGVRRTSCETEHAVTFYRAMKVKSQKSYEGNYVLSSANVCAICMFSTALVFEYICAYCFCRCDMRCSCAECILLPCCFHLTNQGVWHSQRTDLGTRKLVSTRHSRRAAACLCKCDMRCSRSEFILLPCCFDLTTLGVRYSMRTRGLDGWYLICQITSNNLRCEMDFHAEANSQTKWKI